ncbi:hypothetical protein K502DRAFT_339553 [Neoconidiobolus thromboides FSU 785]|nr:hypothetical protein K502DRAFT_339553 [Neoconidiobolus thromboides FSU 785]
MNPNVPTEKMLDILLDDLERVEINGNHNEQNIDKEEKEETNGLDFSQIKPNQSQEYSKELLSEEEEEFQNININEQQTKKKAKPTKIRISLTKEVKKEEKEEKVPLTNKTRLVTLPAKDSQEEEKHLKEYLNMMKISNEKEKKKEEERKEKIKLYEKEQHLRKELWETKYLVDIDKNLKLIYSDLYDGLPTAVREKGWQLFFKRSIKSNTKNQYLKQINEEEYQFLLNRFQHSNNLEYQINLDKNYQRIELQIKSTFPNLHLFQKNCPYYQNVKDILIAYASLKPELLIKLTIANLASILLLNLNDYWSFIGLQLLCNNPVLDAFMYHNNNSIYTKFIVKFEHAFLEKLPKLYLHFQKIKLKSEMYLHSWIENYYTNMLKLEDCLILWDYLILLPESEFQLLIEVGILILKHQEIHLYNNRIDEILNYLINLELQLTNLKQSLFLLLKKGNFIK